MHDISILQLIKRAMAESGANGLWNAAGPCGCGRDDLAPCGGIQTSCVLAKSAVVTEDDDDDINEVGATVWHPMWFKAPMEYYLDTDGLIKMRVVEPTPTDDKVV